MQHWKTKILQRWQENHIYVKIENINPKKIILTKFLVYQCLNPHGCYIKLQALKKS